MPWVSAYPGHYLSVHSPELSCSPYEIPFVYLSSLKQSFIWVGAIAPLSLHRVLALNLLDFLLAGSHIHYWLSSSEQLDLGPVTWNASLGTHGKTGARNATGTSIYFCAISNTKQSNHYY